MDIERPEKKANFLLNFLSYAKVSKTVLHTPEIHIIIPIFNGWKQTNVCLDALRAGEYKNLEIIVVDHGSTDKNKISLPVQYPEVVHVLGDPSPILRFVRLYPRTLKEFGQNLNENSVQKTSQRNKYKLIAK